MTVRAVPPLTGTLPLLLCAALAVRPASAQTIRPIVSEYQNKAQGKFEVVNESDRPLNVVIEPRGFTVDEGGEMRDEPLRAGIHLKLSVTSLRIPPKQTRLVFYEATADTAPAWFVLYANFSGFPRRNFTGLNVQLELPHLVYLLPKTRWTASDVQVVSTRLQRDENKMIVELENQGAQFGRLTGLEIQAARRSLQVPGFPLFPGIRRRVEVRWDSDDIPDAIVIKSNDFSTQRTLLLDNR